MEEHPADACQREVTALHLEGHLATAHLAVQQGGAVLVEQHLNAARSTSYFLSCSIYVIVGEVAVDEVRLNVANHDSDPSLVADVLAIEAQTVARIELVEVEEGLMSARLQLESHCCEPVQSACSPSVLMVRRAFITSGS